MIRGDEIHVAAHLFDPARLTLARELRGLTKSELATKVEKSPSAISQFEGGRARPDPHTLRRLTLALGLPLGFFAKRNRVPLIPVDACHFRSLRSASQRDRRRLLAQAVLLSELVVLLEEQVDLPSEKITPVAQAAVSLQDIESAAVEVRRRWGLGLGPIPNVVGLLESQGVLVLPIAEGCAEVDAFSFWAPGGRPCVFLVLDKASPSRTRFDAAHELGHLVLHADVVPGEPSVERQAHRFASAFLMPRDSFGQECPRRLNLAHFLELKRRWGVSLAALFTRARDLGRLSEASYRRAFVELARSGQRLHEPEEPAPEPPRMLRRALELVAADLPADAIADKLNLYRANLDDLLGPTQQAALGEEAHG